MTNSPALVDARVPFAASAIRKPFSPQRLAMTLVSFGMLAATVAYLSYDFAVRAQMRPDELIPVNIVKPPLYYAAHAVQIALLAAGGILALLTTSLSRIERGYMLRLGLLLAAAALMTVRGYSYNDLLSTKLVDGTGPFPFIVTLLVFAGARRDNWRDIEKLLFGLAAVFTVLALYRMAGLQTFTRQEGVANLENLLNVLYWPAAWMALSRFEKDSFASHVKFIPIFVYTLGSFFTQTRLNFIMVVALLILYAHLQRRRGVRQAGLWTGAVFVTVWAGLFVAIFLQNTSGFARLQDVGSAFASRIDEDSRTEQLTAFFESVAPSELLLGRGSLATWDWDGYEWRGGTDVGYLTLLLFGGVPLLLAYIATHVQPCFTAFFRRTEEWQVTAAAVGLLWALRMFSSSYPGVSLDYYPVLFFIGAAISREPRFE